MGHYFTPMRRARQHIGHFTCARYAGDKPPPPSLRLLHDMRDGAHWPGRYRGTLFSKSAFRPPTPPVRFERYAAAPHHHAIHMLHALTFSPFRYYRYRDIACEFERFTIHCDDERHDYGFSGLPPLKPLITFYDDNGLTRRRNADECRVVDSRLPGLPMPCKRRHRHGNDTRGRHASRAIPRAYYQIPVMPLGHGQKLVQLITSRPLCARALPAGHARHAAARGHTPAAHATMLSRSRAASALLHAHASVIIFARAPAKYYEVIFATCWMLTAQSSYRHAIDIGARRFSGDSAGGADFGYFRNYAHFIYYFVDICKRGEPAHNARELD